MHRSSVDLNSLQPRDMKFSSREKHDDISRQRTTSFRNIRRQRVLRRCSGDSEEKFRDGEKERIFNRQWRWLVVSQHFNMTLQRCVFLYTAYMYVAETLLRRARESPIAAYHIALLIVLSPRSETSHVGTYTRISYRCRLGALNFVNKASLRLETQN